MSKLFFVLLILSAWAQILDPLVPLTIPEPVLAEPVAPVAEPVDPLVELQAKTLRCSSQCRHECVIKMLSTPDTNGTAVAADPGACFGECS